MANEIVKTKSQSGNSSTAKDKGAVGAKKAVKKADDKTVKDIVKKKPRGGNSPMIGDNGLILEPGDNAKYLKVSMQLMQLPNIDLKDPKQVNERLALFFDIHCKNDMKPTVAGMAMALGSGITRQTLWAIKTGNPVGGNNYLSSLPKEVADCIKKAYILMENLWENYMQNGKINPVSGIFLGKNNFGYQDKTEYVVTPNINQDSDYSAEDIKKRYLTDSSDSDNDSNSSDS